MEVSDPMSPDPPITARPIPAPPIAAPPPEPGSYPGQHLDCGADVDDLLEQVADGHADRRTDHQQHCPHCQAALLELADVWAPVHRLASQSVQVPAGLTAAVMRHIQELVRDVWHTLHRTDDGAIRVAGRVVADLARRAASRVPGVGVAFGRSSTGSDATAAPVTTADQPAVGVLGRTAIVDLTVAITYGQPIVEIARRVQQQVITELHDTIGLRRITVNVSVDDVLPAPE
jgi:uncharacterized alkaline shock family protein YloU